MFILNNKVYAVLEMFTDLSSKRCLVVIEEYEDQDCTIKLGLSSCLVTFDNWDGDTRPFIEEQIKTMEWDFYDKEQVIDILKPPKTLTDLKREKALTIDLTCRNEITSGFTSDALGFLVTYPSNQTDQLNLLAAVTESYDASNPIDWSVSLWYKNSLNEWVTSQHNSSQLRKVNSDCKQMISSLRAKNTNLQSQINSATTIEALNLITWS